MIDDNEVRLLAEIVFSANMERHGFSFTPLGIYKAAFDEKGKLHRNWKLKMRMHQPEPAEHPKLYEPPRYLGERRKMNG